MNFTDADVRALANFLARRVTPELQPAPPANDLSQPVDPVLVSGWEDALKRARAAGRLRDVVRRAAEARPEDEALQETAQIVAVNGPPVRPARSAVLALVVMLVLTFGGGSVATFGAMAMVRSLLPSSAPVASLERDLEADQPPDVQPLSERCGIEECGAEAPEALEVSETVVASTEAPQPPLTLHVPPAVPAAPAPPARPAPAPAAEPPQIAARTAPARAPAPSGTHPCDRAGWFYMARKKVPPVGESFSLSAPVNVRAEPPSKKNRWNARASVRCYLAKGDIVTLSQPPMILPGGERWIHVEPGDVIRPELPEKKVASR